MLKLNLNGTELQILKDDAVIFSIIKGNEILHTGYGENKFKMDRGSFKISEKIFSDKAISVKDIKASGSKAEITLTEGKALIEVKKNLLNVKLTGLQNYNRLVFSIPALSNEHVYGTGETFTEFDLRGQKVNVWVAEHQNSRVISKKIARVTLGMKHSTHKDKFSDYETYYAQPTFISSRKYFFHSDCNARCEFDFTAPDRHTLKFDSVAGFTMGFGNDFEEVLENLSSVLGRQPELPDWVYNGAILGIQGGTDIMFEKLQKCLDHGMDVTGIWIQDWEGRRITTFGKQLMWNWEWDSELYPGLDTAIKDLAEADIKVLGYCNPFLAIEKPLYKEATAKGYCVKNKKGEDYYVTITTFPAAMVDLTNPEAYEWLKGIIKKNMIDFGLAGWMADFAEYLPTDAVLYSGESAELVHNTWPGLWAKLNREAIEESGKLGEIMFFTRAGHTKTPLYSTMMWNGDNHVDFSYDNGLPSVIPAMLSLTCSGFGLSHSDIGGYTTFGKLCRDTELYMRWCELAAFSPVMRSHEGNNPDLNAQFDANEEVLNHQTLMAGIHTALKPYIKDAVKYNAKKGVGVVRPLFFYYDEEQAYRECYEYLLGRDILVAPVIRPGAVMREVYLPEDEWVRLATGEEYAGGTHRVAAPVGQPAVFYRKNASPEVLEIIKKAMEVKRI
ncbi:MAG: alpha-glucosidase [Clostridia bacterium]|nr:alpha-glucosidase [Clostridia bacterium]